MSSMISSAARACCWMQFRMIAVIELPPSRSSARTCACVAPTVGEGNRWLHALELRSDENIFTDADANWRPADAVVIELCRTSRS